MRELENVLERAVAMCENGNITDEDLRLTTRSAFADANEAGMPPAESSASRTFAPMSIPPRAAAPFPPSVPQDSRFDEEFPGDLAAAVAETERAAIMKALEATRWNRTAAAKQLGLTLRQLRYRLEKLGIE